MGLWVLDVSNSWKFEQTYSAILPTQNSTQFRNCIWFHLHIHNPRLNVGIISYNQLKVDIWLNLTTWP
jgi:hypothetical protein